jgi:prepilin-type N-terminal cleavage/methylation domain-containing protein
MMRRGFTLLEVVISLGILATALVVLIDTQAFAVLSTNDAERISAGTRLAQEKMMEVQIVMEREGFGEQDIEEEGDFEDFGAEDFRGEDLHLDLAEELKDFKWAYTVRKVELTIPGNLGGMFGDLAGSGYFGEEKADQVDVGNAPDLGDMGISPDMISDQLSGFLREVRILVWWGENEDETDQVELVSHIINPSGLVGIGPQGPGDMGGGADGKGGANGQSGSSKTVGGGSSRRGGGGNNK